MRLITIIGVDEGEEMRLIYVYDQAGKIVEKTKRAKHGSEVLSITKEYPNAEFYEREIHDFYGLQFKGCPNLDKRLFKAEDDNSLPFRVNP